MMRDMQVDIPYGKEKINVKISQPCEVLVPNKVIVKDQDKIIEKALKNPIGKESFEQFAKIGRASCRERV